jgi:RNA-binding motif X-linked protein 2
MNVIREIDTINSKELAANIFGGVTRGSWHDKYRNSAWVYIGGLSYELSEGDIVCVMSQWGEVEDINVIRDKGTGKSLGYAFVKYDDQRSTILAVDNFNGTTLLGRTLRCDHVDQYKLPKEVREHAEQLLEENPDADVSVGPGHAYLSKELANEYSVSHGLNLWGGSVSGGGSKRSGDHLDSETDDSTVSGQQVLERKVDDGRAGKKLKKEKKDKKSKKDKKDKKPKKSKVEHHSSDKDRSTKYDRT